MTGPGGAGGTLGGGGGASGIAAMLMGGAGGFGAGGGAGHVGGTDMYGLGGAGGSGAGAPAGGGGGSGLGGAIFIHGGGLLIVEDGVSFSGNSTTLGLAVRQQVVLLEEMDLPLGKIFLSGREAV